MYYNFVMIDVTCAIIERHGMVLVVCRGQGRHLAGLWEFPGGKLHPGESPRQCIVREIREELCLEVSPYASLEPSVHSYPEKTIRLLPFLCTISPGTGSSPGTGGELELREHAEARWLWPEDLRTLELCPADVPVALSYIEHLG